MGMKLMCEDVQKGTTEEVAGYGSITLHTGNAFIEAFGQREATRIGGKLDVSNVRHPDNPDLIRHSAVVSIDGKPIAHYYGEWNDETGDEDN